MTRDQLIANVALRMDEITPDNGLPQIEVDGSDNNPLYALIDGLIEAGALELFSVAPFWRLKQTEFNDIVVEALPALFNNANGSPKYIIRLKVPDDFLRVAEISCTGFQRPITEVFPEQSAEGRRQHNRWLIAKEARPVGVISHGVWTSGGTSSQCREIDCYSISSVISASEVSATYIAKPSNNIGASPSTVEDDIPEVLVPALEWLIAARVFGARGDVNHAQICQQNAQNLLV